MERKEGKEGRVGKERKGKESLYVKLSPPLFPQRP